jgi:signal transduction histidine kinase
MEMSLAVGCQPWFNWAEFVDDMWDANQAFGQERRIRTCWWLGLTVLAWMLSSIPVEAQRSAQWRVFRAPDGMAESLTTLVAASSNGVVWVRHGNADVVTRYDGYEFKTYPAPEGIGRIRENDAGQIWATYAGGFQQLIDGQWQKHPVELMAAESRTNSARRLRPAPFLIGNGDQVFVLLRDRLLDYRTTSRNVSTVRDAPNGGIGMFNDFCRAQDGGLWLTGEKGVAHGRYVTQGTNRVWRWTDYPLPDSARVQGIVQPVEDESGGVVGIAELQGSEDRSIIYLSRDAVSPTFVATGRFRRAWHVGAGVFWADTVDGLFARTAKDWIPVLAEGIIAGRIHDIAIAPGGVFWLATTEGLVRFGPTLWSMPSHPDEFNGPVHALFEDPHGQIWGISSQCLLALNRDGWSTYPIVGETELPFQPTDSLFNLADGRVVASANNRLWVYNVVAARFEEMKSPGGKPIRFLGRYRSNLFCVQVLESNEQSPRYHLELFSGRRFSAFPDPDPPTELGQELTLLMVARNGDVWLGSKLGIARYHNSEWLYFDPKANEAPTSVQVLLEARQGDIWCGSETRLYRFNGRGWTVAKTGFDRVSGLIQATDDSLWVASGSGLFWYSRNTWMMHGVEEGLPSEAVYDVMEDHQGRIWAGTARGLSQFNPNADVDPPQADITREKETLDIDPNGTLTLGFEGHDRWALTLPERIMYSYHVDDGVWSPYRKVNVASLENLSPGRHRVEVKAMDRNWNESRLPAAFSFNVRLPWYRETRLVAVSLVGLGMILVLAALAVNRHLRLVRSYAEVEQIVRQRTEELERAQQALLHSQKMRALGTLAAGIAHDFNSILSIIKGSAQIIDSHLDDKEKIRTRVNRIKTSVDQGSAIVKALLGYGGTARHETEPMDTNAIVQETVQLLEDRLGEAVRIRFTPGKMLPPITIAKDLLQQILLNILNNAAEAMGGKGEVKLNTEVVELAPNGVVLPPAPAVRYVTVAIQDSGCGIPSDIRNRIFEPFFTTKALSTRKGTGLGLSMVFEFAKDQGCGLKVDSDVGHGSTFTLYLPIKDHPSVHASPPIDPKLS